MPSCTNLFSTWTMLGVTVGRLAGAPDCAPVTRFERTIAQNATLAPDRAATPESRWSRVYIDDAYVRDAVVRSLDGAAEWLKAPKCQSLLSEFADQHGRPLRERLATLNMTLAGYLSVLIFEDGEARPQCERPSGTWPLRLPATVSCGSAVGHSPEPGSASPWRAEPRSFMNCFILWGLARIRPSRDPSRIGSSSCAGSASHRSAAATTISVWQTAPPWWLPLACTTSTRSCSAWAGRQAGP